MDSIVLSVNASGLQGYLERKRSSVVNMLTERVNAVNAMFADRVRANLSGGVLQTRSGKLLGTVQQNDASASGKTITGSVQAGGAEAPYGAYFEEGGTSYYTIRPVNARVLAFMSEGKQIFAKSVNHPPIPRLPWFSPEAEAIAPEMQTQLQDAINEALNE